MPRPKKRQDRTAYTRHSPPKNTPMTVDPGTGRVVYAKPDKLTPLRPVGARRRPGTVTSTKTGLHPVRPVGKRAPGTPTGHPTGYVSPRKTGWRRGPSVRPKEGGGLLRETEGKMLPIRRRASPVRRRR